MASTKDRISRSLIGFEQGVSIKTVEQLRSQTRARFSPLSNPKISFSLKKDQKASALIKVTSLPSDPGPGKYNLSITGSNGKVLKIRTADSLPASGNIVVNDYANSNSFWNSGGFIISPFGGPEVKFEIDDSRIRPLYDSSNNVGGFGSPIGPNLMSAGNVYLITVPASNPRFFTSAGAPENKVGVMFRATRSIPTEDVGRVRLVEEVTCYSYKIGLSGLSNESSVNNQRVIIAKRIYDAINLAYINSHLEILPSYSDEFPYLVSLKQTINGDLGNKDINLIGSSIDSRNVSQKLSIDGMKGGLSSFPRALNGKSLGRTRIKFTGVPSSGEITINSGDGNFQTFNLSQSGGGSVDRGTAALALLNSIKNSPLVTSGKIRVSAESNVENRQSDHSFTVSSVSPGRSGEFFVISTLDNVSIPNPSFEYRMHPDDPKAFALGLFDSLDPIFQKEQAEEFLEQRIKRVTFDINNIINSVSKEYGILSTIVGDDTLLITQEPPRRKIRLTGTIDPSASTTVNGVGTFFEDEVNIGDEIVVSGEIRKVVSVTNDSTLTVDSAFTNNPIDTNPKIFKTPSINGMLAPIKINGTVNPTNSTTVIGSETLFKSDIDVGDKILISGEIRTVESIISDTELTVEQAFTDNPIDTSPRVYKTPSINQLGLSSGPKSDKFTLKNWKMLAKELNSNFFLDIPNNSRINDDKSRKVEMTLSEGYIRNKIAKLDSRTSLEDKKFMSIKFMNRVQESKLKEMTQNFIPEQNVVFDQIIDSDAQFIDFYIEKTGDSKKFRITTTANVLNVYVNISNIRLSSTKAGIIDNSYRAFYDNLAIALKYISGILAIDFDCEEYASNSKKITITENDRITGLSVFVAGIKKLDENDIYNNIQPTITWSYSAQPQPGDTLRLTSVDSNRNKITKTYVFTSPTDDKNGTSDPVNTGHKLVAGDQVGGVSLSSINFRVGGIAVEVSAVNANKTYNSLLAAINSANGHNSYEKDSKFIVNHVESNNDSNSGTFTLKQRTLGSIGNTAVISTGNFASIPTSFSSVSINSVDVNFREDKDQFYYLKPNHSLNIRSFGLGKKVNSRNFFDDMSLNGPRRFAATGSISVLSTSGWENTTNFKLQDSAGTKTIPETFITFTCNISETTAAKVNDTNYTFGISGATSTAAIASRIREAIEKARLDSITKLDIFADIPTSNSIILRQGTGGVAGNTTISVSDLNLISFSSFTEKNHKYPQTLSLDPTVFLTDAGDVRFPIQESNYGNILGTEFDGVIEPIEIRQSAVDRMITEIPFYGIKAALIGTYNYSEVRREAEEINNKLVFEKTKIVPFMDNCPTVGSEIGLSMKNIGERKSYLDAIYVKTPGFIFKNERTIYPFIDTEERISQALPLEANNPDNIDNDRLVAEVFELGNPVNLLQSDNRNLGGENYRRTAGFDFSSNPHPGTDSIAFGGLTYV